MKVLVAMSGGVDSTAAAKLLCQQGHTCIGCTMRLYDNTDAGLPRGHTCCSLQDVEDARSAAYRLDMPYYVFNFTDDFRKKVIDKFVNSYLSGVTPNPCIDCNRYMKFDKLYERATILNCTHIATGHYARITCSAGCYVLKKALDETKDQSYVLYTLTQQQLAHTLFPLGEMHKTQTRSFVKENGFLNAEKPDSQDICFVPDGDYARVIQLHAGVLPPPGDFIDGSGQVLGRHRGIVHYTVGQRRGLGLSFGQPAYVCGICPQNNTVILGNEQQLYHSTAFAAEFNWISGQIPDGKIRCRVKIRYRQPEQWATVTPLPGDRAKIVFDTPQRAITPGQAAVLYDEEVVLGGGTVTQVQ